VERSEVIRAIAVCPECLAELHWSDSHARCSGCSRDYPIIERVPRFTEAAAVDPFQAAVMANDSWTARFYNAGRKVLSSEYMPIDHVGEFIRGLGPRQIAVELGAGNRRLSEAVINLDLFPFENVDLVGSAEQTPIKSGSVDAVILDTILEHVPEPQKVVDEVFRILKPGGRAICLAPFIFPYHAYPRHYFNSSKDGLEYLFRRFTRCAVVTNMGPTSAVVNLVSDYFGLAISNDNRFLYSLGKAIALVFTFFFKYLDVLWNRAERSRNLASVLCATAQK
jgi:SAM-dependent methyltransferase